MTAPRQTAIALSDIAWVLGVDEFTVRRRAHREGWPWYAVDVDGADEPGYIIDCLPPLVLLAVTERMMAIAGEDASDVISEAAPEAADPADGKDIDKYISIEDLARRTGIPVHELSARAAREHWPYRIVDSEGRKA